MTDGLRVGVSVGASVGAVDGHSVMDGLRVGVSVGAGVGVSVGAADGLGVTDGLRVGVSIGAVDGHSVTDGLRVGVSVGAADGLGVTDGFCVGVGVGLGAECFFLAVTVTLHRNLRALILAVITAVPFFLAVTLPFWVTEATFFLLDFHIIFFLPETPLTFKVKVLPLVRFSFFLERLAALLPSALCPREIVSASISKPAVIRFFMKSPFRL